MVASYPRPYAFISYIFFFPFPFFFPSCGQLFKIYPRRTWYTDLNLDLLFISTSFIQGVKTPLRPPLQFHASMISQMYFTSFDRARRALQNCMHQKKLTHLFEVENSKNYLENLKKCKRNWFFNGRKTLDFSIKLTCFIIFPTTNVLKCTH
jgi:hypothetical protein